MPLEDEQPLSESVPSQIVFEILARLPVESLLRCKSVCKSWRSLISDPYFIKYHLTLSTTNHHYAHHHLLVYSLLPVFNLKTCPLYDVLNDYNHINPLELDYPMKYPRTFVTIVGSCNGLICIEIEWGDFFIWNPSTRKSIKLPYFPCYDGIVRCGFGYDESSDDYKFVEITCSFQDMHGHKVMIYSLRNGNWKEIGAFPHEIWLTDSNVPLKGALHWIATKDCGSWIIVSLDLAKETYGEILLPVDKEVDTDLRLGILGDCLSVICAYSRNSRLYTDVWVMKVYGVKDSWFKLVTIPYDLEYVEWSNQLWAPLCVSDDGKVLLQAELGLNGLIVFDPKDDSLSEITKFSGCSIACTFVESLVSPGNLI